MTRSLPLVSKPLPTNSTDVGLGYDNFLVLVLDSLLMNLFLNEYK